MTSPPDAGGVVALSEHLLTDGFTRLASPSDHALHAQAIASTNGAGQAEQSTITRDDSNVGDMQCNFESTFRYMTERRLQRRYRGVYKQYSFTTQLVTWIIALYTLSILATFAFGASYTSTENTSVTSDSIFYAVLVLFVLYIFVRVALIIRWLMYWVVIAAMLGYAFTGEVTSIFWLNDDGKLTQQQKTMRGGVVVALAAAEVLTIAVYLFTHHLYPWLVLTNKFDTVSWWNMRPHPSKSNTVTYRSKARFYTKKRNVISYCGGLDDEQLPHGYGMWTDSSFHGERLTGQWRHGVPVGPFRSFEHGSGYCFVNIRIGYCHVRSEARPEQIAFWPKHASDGIHWGVASVECSVSGGFFRFLPAVRHLTPHNGTAGEDAAPQNAADCVPLLRAPTDAVTFHSEATPPPSPRKSRMSTQRRFQSARRVLYRESSCPTIDLPEAEDLTAAAGTTTAIEEKEAVILLHGYNCSLNYGMNRLAQLLALGDFPSHIHPFVFSWPSGGALAYYQARDTGTQSDATAEAFRDFLRSLVDAGYTTIHLIAHSMGARIYFYSLAKGLLDDIFELNDSFVGGGGGQEPVPRRARLATLTFTNADYERDKFVKRGGGYDQSRRFCRCITVYADNMDGALFFSEIFGRRSLFAPLAYSLGKRGHMLYRDADSHRGDSSAGDDASVDASGHNNNVHNLTQNEMDHAIALVNQRGRFDGVASFAYNHTRPADLSTGRRVWTELGSEDAPRDYLDVDVIDTTWMDNNVHSIRHNYFNLNPTLVEDLRCLVVNQQRASLRPGLLKTSDNVYIFLVAPSHIKNK